MTEAKTVEPSTASSADASHIRALIDRLKAQTPPAPPIGETGGGSIGGASIGVSADGFIGKDEFFGMFRFVFAMGHGVTSLQSLNIEGNEAARPACDALYDIAQETPSLHFLIKSGGVWMQRVAAIGVFAVPVGMGCLAELKQRKAERLAAAEPANENEPSAAAAANDNVMGEFENATN